MRRIFTFLIIASLLLSGCGRTIITTSSPTADIYINSTLKGRGTAEVTRRGPPLKYYIEAKEGGVVVAKTIIRRKFDVTTCVIGYFTYGVGLILGWRFPSDVYLNTPVKEQGEQPPVLSPWDAPPAQHGW